MMNRLMRCGWKVAVVIVLALGVLEVGAIVGVMHLIDA